MDKLIEAMDSPSRRQFLAAGAAGMLMAGLAAAQPAGTSNRKLSEILYPGAVDAEGKYSLPQLRYEYDALEPHIDAETMRLHHSRHHQGYVNGLIAAEEKMAEMRESGQHDQVEHQAQKAAFHGAGHFLHTVFWVCMAPEGRRGEVSGALAQRIEEDFGSREAMLAQFRAAAGGVEGSGWGLITYSVPARKLVILQARNHQLATQWANIPLLVVDVWEHAYYKKYGPARGDYVGAFVETIDWGSVSERYEAVAEAFG